MNNKYIIKPGFEIQEVCGNYVLLGMGEENIDFSKVIVLNETSKFLWDKMKEGKNTIASLVESITEEYEVEKDVAQQDIEKIVNKFIEAEVVKIEIIN